MRRAHVAGGEATYFGRAASRREIYYKQCRMAAARTLSQLPDELQLAVLDKVDAITLVAVAATCRSLCRLSDIAAQFACGSKGCHQKGAWSRELSWRVILCGRSFRSGMRLRRFIGKGNTRRSGGLFQQPTAIAALPAGTAVVCNALSRTIAIVSLDPGELLATLAVDGAPCGVCYLMTHTSVSSDEAARFSFAVSIQGLSESGERLEGVRNTSHRVEVFLFDPAGKELTYLHSRLQLNADGPGLSFPNGLCTLASPTQHPSAHQALSIGKLWLACADWNNHRVAILSTGDDNTILSDLQTDIAMATRGLQRPADCTVLADGSTLAIIGYYSDAVLLVDLFLTNEQRLRGLRTKTAMSPGDAPTSMHAQLGAGDGELTVRAVGKVSRRRCGGAGLQRPSGLCVEP
eukprot:5487797-Pleurochrysis_carterae.AAC.1